MNPLFTEPVLIVVQQYVAFDTAANYTIHHPQGVPIAHVREEASAAKKVLRLLSKMDDKVSRTLHVVDAGEAPLLTIHKGFAFALPKTTVSGADGEPIGEIGRQLAVFTSKFTLSDPAGNPVGSISGNFTGWDFTVADMNGVELARINKQFHGLVNELFTEADRYVVQMTQNVQGPFRALIVATAIALDVVLHENANR